MVPTGFNLSSLIDVGFVLLVTVACLKSLGSGSSPAERVAERWRTELRELEKVLRGLISDASTASSNLDRRLLKRKTELEQLLKKLENGQPSPAVLKPKAPRPETEIWELGEISELPNETWRTESPVSGEDEEESAGDTTELDDLLDSAVDSVSLSPTAQRAAAGSAKPPMRAQNPTPSILRPPSAKSLSSKIEVIKSPLEEAPEQTAEDIASAQTFSQMSIMDPSAYKIARRLLGSGTEIHIVARKLDLPVSEVRLLDKLMRQEGVTRASEVEVGPNYKPIEPVPASKIVRSKSLKDKISKERAPQPQQPALPAPRPARVEFQAVELTPAQALPEWAEISNDDAESLEHAIEREVALL